MERNQFLIICSHRIINSGTINIKAAVILAVRITVVIYADTQITKIIKLLSVSYIVCTVT